MSAAAPADRRAWRVAIRNAMHDGLVNRWTIQRG